MTENNLTLAELEAELKRQWDIFHDEQTEKGRNARFKQIRDVGRQISVIRKAAEQAEEARKAAVRQETWASVQIAPIPFLKNLREAVIGGPEPPKRTPKWRLKLADDLGLEIHAKDSTRLLFECRALQGEKLDAGSFTEKRAEHHDLWQMNFRILQDGDQWVIKPGTCWYGAFDAPKDDWSLRKKIQSELLRDFKKRVVEVLIPEFFQGHVAFFSDNCLACGKALTDAVSRSRRLGPECAGKSSIVAPLCLLPPDAPAQGRGAAI